MSRPERRREARAAAHSGQQAPRRAWWLVGAGAVAVAAAVIAIVVAVVVTSDGDKVDDDLLVPPGAHVLGAPDAPVTLVVFSSFTCPACTMFALWVEEEIIAEYVASGKVRLVHRMVGVDSEAQMAAEAAECAAAQGGFLEYYRALYANWISPNPAAFSRESLKRFATNAGLDANALAACLESREYALRVRHEREAVGALGVEYTPTVFINGEKVVGVADYEVYTEIIERELTEAK